MHIQSHSVHLGLPSAPIFPFSLQLTQRAARGFLSRHNFSKTTPPIRGTANRPTHWLSPDTQVRSSDVNNSIRLSRVISLRIIDTKHLCNTPSAEIRITKHC